MDPKIVAHFETLDMHNCPLTIMHPELWLDECVYKSVSILPYFGSMSKWNVADVIDSAWHGVDRIRCYKLRNKQGIERIRSEQTDIYKLAWNTIRTFVKAELCIRN